MYAEGVEQSHPGQAVREFHERLRRPGYQTKTQGTLNGCNNREPVVVIPSCTQFYAESFCRTLSGRLGVWRFWTWGDGFEVAHFCEFVWPKACFHRSLGQRPRFSRDAIFVWPKACFHRSLGQRPRFSRDAILFGQRPYSPFPRCQMNLAFGQEPFVFPVPGALPQATVMIWPSAKAGHIQKFATSKTARVH